MHGPLASSYSVFLCSGPFAGSTVQVSGCCAAPWLFLVSQTPEGLQAWHPEEADGAPELAEHYLRDGTKPQHALPEAIHLPNANRQRIAA